MSSKQKYRLPAYTALVLTCLAFLIPAAPAAAQGTWTRSNCPRSQKQAMVWYFGEKAGIDFRSGQAVPLADGNLMNAFQATASVCDSVGNFRFFTNGKVVWDTTFSPMPNGTGLAGDPGVTQPCLIVPMGREESQYMVFTVDMVRYDLLDSTKYTTQGLRYSIIDMRERNGLGDAVSSVLNLPLVTPSCQKLTAVANHSKTGIWVIAHKWESDEFHAYLVTGSGIVDSTVSAVGTRHSASTKLARNNMVGYMKCSPDGTRLALSITYDKRIELFDFDNETGRVSNPRSYVVNKPDIHPYGIEFSPSGRMLYASVLDYLGGTVPKKPTCLYQFDLNNGLTNPVIIDSAANVRWNALQLAPDGRIYISRTNNLKIKRDSLEVIYNPDRPGSACNLNRLDHNPGVRFDLLGRKSIYSLPNLVQSYLYLPPFTWDSVCEGDVTRFRITNPANIDAVSWDFGDGATSSLPDPMHPFSTPGQYTVRLTLTYEGQSFTDSVRVVSHPKPFITLEDTVLLYTGSTITLHAGEGFPEYLWSTGSAASTIVAGTQGSYWARVKDVYCCTHSDTTYVKVFEYFIPNAFSPNGDGLNDVFRVNGLYRNINFSMVIFDRWGQMVFESDDVDKGWDGKAGGQVCPPESYIWVVKISFPGQDIITSGDVVFKGVVNIVQ